MKVFINVAVKPDEATPKSVSNTPHIGQQVGIASVALPAMASVLSLFPALRARGGQPFRPMYRVNYVVHCRECRTTRCDCLWPAVVEATLRDPRGWLQFGIRLHRVSSHADAHFSVTMESAAWFALEFAGIPALADLSVTVMDPVFPRVYLNRARWTGALPNGSGMSLRNYRRYLVNHEVGHALGASHVKCERARDGSPVTSPVMLQQTKGTCGCVPSPWPNAEDVSAAFGEYEETEACHA